MEKYDRPDEQNRLRALIGEISWAVLWALLAFVIMGFIISVVLPFILK